jgi:hypothetical protein
MTGGWGGPMMSAWADGATTITASAANMKLIRMPDMVLSLFESPFKQTASRQKHRAVSKGQPEKALGLMETNDPFPGTLSF